jgi:hypothetical protein
MGGLLLSPNRRIGRAGHPLPDGLHAYVAGQDLGPCPAAGETRQIAQMDGASGSERPDGVGQSPWSRAWSIMIIYIDSQLWTL